MNQLKQKLSIFDLSILLDKIKSIEEQQLCMLHLNKRPTYDEIQEVSQTQQIVSDFELKRKFREIQKDSFPSWKPERTQCCRSFAQTPNHPRIKISPKFQELRKKTESTPLPLFKIRSRSNGQRKKSETKDIDEQFAETRNLIRRFNRIKKEVRFDVFS